MNKDEALRLALEALEKISMGGDPRWADPAITSIKEALETKDEPFEYWNAIEGWVKIDEVKEHFESVKCGTIYKNGGEGRVPLYTTPPQRKPLTDEQLLVLLSRIDEHAVRLPKGLRGFARAIENAHGIKE